MTVRAGICKCHAGAIARDELDPYRLGPFDDGHFVWGRCLICRAPVIIQDRCNLIVSFNTQMDTVASLTL